MIWLDSSFVVEWLLGTERAETVKLPAKPFGILPAQYAETMAFFLKRGLTLVSIVNELEALELIHPGKSALQLGSQLYVEVRSRKRKPSLADAILAATVQERKEPLLSFDNDFALLGLVEKKAGYWLRSP